MSTNDQCAAFIQINTAKFTEIHLKIYLIFLHFVVYFLFNENIHNLTINWEKNRALSQWETWGGKLLGHIENSLNGHIFTFGNFFVNAGSLMKKMSIDFATVD